MIKFELANYGRLLSTKNKKIFEYSNIIPIIIIIFFKPPVMLKTIGKQTFFFLTHSLM